MIELNITAFLDMMSTILFFLLLSVSFVNMTSLTLPPAAKSLLKNPFAAAPLSPKIYLFSLDDQSLRLVVSWKGAEPGEFKEDIARVASDKVNENLIILSTKLVSALLQKYPAEKSVQLSLASDVNYQELVSVMDGIRAKISEIVLLSYEESHAKAREQVKGGI